MLKSGNEIHALDIKSHIAILALKCEISAKCGPIKLAKIVKSYN